MSGRPRNTDAAFAPLESKIMDAIWSADHPLSVRQVLVIVNSQRSEPLAYTTVMTVMNRLVGKRALDRAGAPRSYVYAATRSDEAGIAVRSVIETYGDAAVAHLVDEARADPQMMDRLRALLAEEDA